MGRSDAAQSAFYPAKKCMLTHQLHPCAYSGLYIITTAWLLETSEYSIDILILPHSHYSPQSLQEPSILQDFRSITAEGTFSY